MSPARARETLTATPTATDERFARFWQAYPNRTGKGAARKSWTKLNPSEDLTVRILGAIAQQKTWPAWTRDDGRFIPHPATWLNQTRWEDEPVQTNPSLLQSHHPKTAGNADALRRFVEHAGAGEKP